MRKPKLKSILITGGAGFFGRNFVRQCLEKNEYERICIFSRDEWKQAQMRSELKDDQRLRFFIGDVRDQDRLRRAMDGVDVVVHAAALKRIEVGAYNPTELVKTNVIGTMNAVEAAVDAGIKKFVFLSTDKAFEPVSPYGHSKAMAEKIVLAANEYSGRKTKFSACRYGNVAGSTGSVIPVWRFLLQSGCDSVPVSDPECTRFWMTINQAVDLVMRLIDDMSGGEVSIPWLPAFRIGDLAIALGAKMDVRGLGAFEKKHESMTDGNKSDTARLMTVDELKEALTYVG